MAISKGVKSTNKPGKERTQWKRLRRYPATMIGFGIVLFFLLMAFFGSLVAPYSFSEQNLSNRLQPPSREHLFGTDQFGRDVFSRVLIGSRDVYVVAGSGALLAVVIGLTIGLIAGYFGGIIDEILMRLIDVLLAIPPLLLAMIVLFALGTSRLNVILVVGFLYIPMVARVVRSVVLDLKTRQFVEAAKLRGETSLYIMFREILPSVLPPLAVEASMRFSYAIFLVASLGFLGLGVQPPSPDWGLMVGEARTFFSVAQWPLLAPAGAVVLLVIGVAFMSDGLRRMLLPGGGERMSSIPPENTGQNGLEIQNLTITYDTDAGPLDTVRNVSLKVEPGEIYGLVGESGSGKTTLARAVVRYLASNGRIREGHILLDGVDLLTKTKQEMRQIWGSNITMVHQDPNRSVNPSMPVGDQIAEMVKVHKGLAGKEAKQKAVEMLSWVRMPDPARVARRYAHQLSGGQLQRVLIAIALITNPRLLIMDEPTTALDVTTEAVILDLIRDLLKEYQTAVLYITHNLGVVARLCHRVGVIYAGEMMEQGPVQSVFKEMLHPYTLGLLGSVPRVDVDKQDIVLNTIPGYIPQPGNLPAGCIFSPRCKGVQEECCTARPPLVDVPFEPGHVTACRRWEALRDNPGEFSNPQKKRDYHEPTTEDIVLEARQIKKHFPVSRVRLKELIGGNKPVIRAVDDISIRVRKSFTVGIVGESGCGKTTFARCIAGLEKATSGDILLKDEQLSGLVSKRSPEQLKNIQMVFQNPDASLNPQLTVGSSVARPLILLKHQSKKQIRERVEELFHAVNLPIEYISRLPHEISGGEKQRVAIARAFATDPKLMICDEPISSLDVSVQASLMNMLMELQDTKGTSYLFISHDLAAVRHLSSWIAVIYLGRMWELGSAVDVLKPPQHPYTEALFSALPIPDPEAQQNRIRLRGDVPSAVNIPSGCRFHPRCPRKIGEICETEEPPWQDAGHWHRICCHIPLEELAAVQSGEGDTVS